MWIFWKKPFGEKRKTITDNTPEIIRLQHILLTHICWVNKCFVPTGFIYFPLLQVAAGLLPSGLFQDCKWGKRIISSSQSSSLFARVCLELESPLVRSHSPSKMHYFTDAWMQTGPQLRTPSMQQGAAGSCTQPTRKAQIQPSLSLWSNFSETYFRPLQNVLQKSDFPLWNTQPGRVGRQKHQGMLCSTFLLRPLCWGAQKDFFLPKLVPGTVVLAQFWSGFNKPLKLLVPRLILLKMMTQIIFSLNFVLWSSVSSIMSIYQ